MGLQETTYITIETIAFVITFVSIIMMFAFLSNNIFRSILYGSALVRASIVGGAISAGELKPKEYSYSFYTTLDESLVSLAAPAKNVFGLDIKKKPAWVGYPMKINDPRRVFIIYEKDLTHCEYDLIACIRDEKKDCVDYKECFDDDSCTAGTVMNLKKIMEEKRMIYNEDTNELPKNFIWANEKIGKVLMNTAFLHGIISPYECNVISQDESKCYSLKIPKKLVNSFDIISRTVEDSDYIAPEICKENQDGSKICYFKKTDLFDLENMEKQGWIFSLKNLVGVVGFNYYNNIIPSEEIRKKLKINKEDFGEVIGLCVLSIQ